MTVGTTTYPAAIGDGIADDTLAIRGHLLAMDPLVNPPVIPPNVSGPNAPRHNAYAGLYFPAGKYKVIGPVVVPWLINVRIFGDGGRGGETAGASDWFGSVIVQHTPGEPIFLFNEEDTHSVLIERLGFSWATPQDAPPDWEEQAPHLAQSSKYTDPGAVGILFTGNKPGDTPGNCRRSCNGSFYQITIRDCRFHQGWRGIAIDDTYADGAVSVWDTQIDRCTFGGMRGAAISLVNHPTRYVGMPSNSITGCFIENYSHTGAPLLANEYQRRNVEPQIRLGSQSGMRIEGLDAEGSKTTVLYAADCEMTIRAMYLEHLEIGYKLKNGTVLEGVDGAPYALVLGLYGGEYVIGGLHIDGTINAKDPNAGSTFSRIIHAISASVTVSSVRARLLSDPAGHLDVVDGFHIENGDALFFHTNTDGGYQARFRAVGVQHLEASSNSNHKLKLFDGSVDGNTTADAVAARVDRDLRVERITLTFPSVAAGRIGTPVIPSLPSQPPPFPGARVGDLVHLAPPAGFPVACLAQGVVTAPDSVQVRVFNSGTSTVSVPAGVWTVAYGRGPLGDLLAPGA